MIISSKQLTQYSIHATDATVGGIKDILFDDETYTTRYLVADTNTWLPLSRKVVISPVSVSQVDMQEESVHVDMTVDTLKNSPSIDEHKPVSREYEEHLFKYFGYGYYWIGPGAWGEYAHPNELVTTPTATEADAEGALPSESTNHLRACGEINGYEVATTDDKVGHISEFLIDTTTWQLVMLVVDTNNWLPGGKHVALLPRDIKQIDWAAHSVVVNLSHDDLLQRPEVDGEKLGDGSYIAALVAQIDEA
ncbi:PRC-barrel domain-containing protein [Alteromonas sp. A081]|uniref:PRC-barrel domain-containing protein n=1 Tax=Alteromonas sp. A081 TaxID=3410269 RepID=UPI003B985F84